MAERVHQVLWSGLQLHLLARHHCIIVLPKPKIDQTHYRDESLKKLLLSWSQKHSDGRPLSSNRIVAQGAIRQCKSNFPGPPDEWPACSPDLNPLDYSIWGLLWDRVGYKSYRSVASLKLAEKIFLHSTQKLRRKITKTQFHKVSSRTVFFCAIQSQNSNSNFQAGRSGAWENRIF